MESDSGDLLLKMVLNGNPIKGASQTVLQAPGKPMSKLATGFDPGFMIEIDNFTLRCGTSGLEPGAVPPPPPSQHNVTWATHEKDEDEKKESLGAVARRGGYQAWRRGDTNIRYPLDIQPITFTKPADMSSEPLIQSCIDCTSYDSATIVKRRPVGSALAGEIYMRIDFTGVLVIKVDWADEDDYIKETVSFIARGITVSYRPMLTFNTMGPIISGFWSMVPDEKQQTFN